MKENYKFENSLLLEFLNYFLHNKKFPSFNSVTDLRRENVDWEYLVDQAEQHQVIPHLYQLVNCNKNIFPKELFLILENKYKNIVANNLLFSSELLRILNLFQEKSIKAVPFKGPVLNSYLYGAHIPRQYCDLDILIHKNDLEIVQEILIENNFIPHMNLSKTQFLHYRKYFNYLSYRKNESIINIDIHWSLFSESYSFSTKEKNMFSKLVPVKLYDRDIETVLGLDLLFLLCIHGTKHGWKKLIWLLDLAKLIQTNEYDIHRINNYYDYKGATRMVFVGLLLVRELFNVQLPGGVLDFEKTKLNKLTEEIKSNYLDGKNNKYFSQERLYFNSLEKKSDKFAFIHDFIFRPTINEFSLISIPERFSFIYFFIRIIRLLFKNIKRIYYR